MNWIELARRLAPLAGLTLLALVLLVVLPGSCRRERTAAATARVEQGAAKAASDNGRDAVETVGRAAARHDADERITRTNQEEIRHANGAEVPVAAAVRAAGIDGLCRRAAYRDDPRCGVRRAAPVGVEGGGGGGAAAGR